MAQAAVVAAATEPSELGSVPLRLKDVVWLAPIVADEPRRVHLAIKAGDRGGFEYEVYSQAETRVVYGQGRALLSERRAGDEKLDLDRLRAGCDGRIDAASCYARWSQRGIEYGPGQRALRNVSIG